MTRRGVAGQAARREAGSATVELALLAPGLLLLAGLIVLGGRVVLAGGSVEQVAAAAARQASLARDPATADRLARQQAERCRGHLWVRGAGRAARQRRRRRHVHGSPGRPDPAGAAGDRNTAIPCGQPAGSLAGKGSRAVNARRPDRGSVTVLAALAGLAMLLMAGLVVDGAGRLRAAGRADRIAAEAARAAAQAADTRRPTLTLDRPAAVRAARRYLAEAGVTGTVTITGPRTVQVAVSVPGHDLILGLLGHPDYTLTRQATASIAVGVTGPGQ
jgi:Flp pilus assembly protein TadG